MRIHYVAGTQEYAFSIAEGVSLPEMATRIEFELLKRHPSLADFEDLPTVVRDALLNSMAGNDENVDLGMLSSRDFPRSKRRRRTSRPHVESSAEFDYVEAEGRLYEPGDEQAPRNRDSHDRRKAAARRDMASSVSRRSWRAFAEVGEDAIDGGVKTGKRVVRGFRLAIPKIGTGLVRTFNLILTIIQLYVGFLVASAFVSGHESAAFFLLVSSGFLYLLQKTKLPLP